MKNEQKNPSTTKNLENGEKIIEQKTVDRDYLTNKLNFINFIDGDIHVNFKHREYDHTITIKAKPEACLGKDLACTWVMGEEEKICRLEAYTFQDIHITNGKNVIIVNPIDFHSSPQGVRIFLPENCIEYEMRKVTRYPCFGISVQLIQNGISFSGKLTDFSAFSFRVEISQSPPQMFYWIDSESNVTLVLSDSQNMIYAGDCKILKNSNERYHRSYVLQPLKDQLRRFKKKEYRTSRHKLSPSPRVNFKHPFTNRFLNLKILDLSGSGFSIEEDIGNAVLIPGMIIPEVNIIFGHNFETNCIAQVVYRREITKNKRDIIISGLAILNMDIEDHIRLLSMLHQLMDEKSVLCEKVDLKELWQFFFDSGFIYPSKYAFIQEEKENIKSVYEKVYNNSPRIARHFLYKDRNRILGHMAMIRFYEKSWLIHHHAAKSSLSNMAGINVLDQIGRFINESHSIYSVQMDYVFCYYRPENKFPHRIFGGVERNTKDPKICSLDLFSYFHYKKVKTGADDLAKPYRLEPVQVEDLVELKSFYEGISGGLMLEALELLPEFHGINQISKEFKELGFKRFKNIVSLKKGNVLIAVILINKSDFGLNMSNVTNGIHMIVVNQENFTNDIFDPVLILLSDWFQVKNIPILIFPESITQKMSLPSEKKYFLWVHCTENLDGYFSYLSRFIKKIKALK